MLMHCPVFIGLSASSRQHTVNRIILYICLILGFFLCDKCRPVVKEAHPASGWMKIKSVEAKVSWSRVSVAATLDAFVYGLLLAVSLPFKAMYYLLWHAFQLACQSNFYNYHNMPDFYNCFTIVVLMTVVLRFFICIYLRAKLISNVHKTQSLTSFSASFSEPGGLSDL